MFLEGGLILRDSDVFLREEARSLVASLYAQLSSSKPSPEKVYEELCEDDYDFPERSKTLVVVHESEGNRVIAGTVRLVLGVDKNLGGLPPLEAMRLIDANWPHREKGIPDSMAGELGRFAIAPEFRDDKLRITRMLFDQSWRVAEGLGIQFLYAIMPHYVANLVGQVGIKIKEVEGFRLRDEDPQARELFQKYDLYWLNSNPRLYQFITE
jgi:hypothetical protein